MDNKVWRVMHPDGSRTVFGNHALALAAARGHAERVEEITLDLHPGPLLRELRVARESASSRGDDDRLDEAEIDLARLQHIERAALLALGLLWMTERHDEKVGAAFRELRNALGGKPALGLGITMAIENGYEADHPEGADWWAGKPSIDSDSTEGCAGGGEEG